jgi:hypothetical protein
LRTFFFPCRFPFPSSSSIFIAFLAVSLHDELKKTYKYFLEKKT